MSSSNGHSKIHKFLQDLTHKNSRKRPKAPQNQTKKPGYCQVSSRVYGTTDGEWRLILTSPLRLRRRRCHLRHWRRKRRRCRWLHVLPSSGNRAELPQLALEGLEICCGRMSLEVDGSMLFVNWAMAITHLLIHGVYWLYDPFTNHGS